MRRWVLTVLLSLGTFFLCVAARAGENSVAIDVQRCVMVFARSASEGAVLAFRPHEVDIKIRVTVTDDAIGTAVFDTDSQDAGEAGELRVDIRLADGEVRARWWTGMPGEYMDFPLLFEKGDWQTLLDGGPVVLVAPGDVLSRIETNVLEEGFDPVRYFHLSLREENSPEGGTLNVTRAEAFHPRFSLSGGYLSVEGMLASAVITVEDAP